MIALLFVFCSYGVLGTIRKREFLVCLVQQILCASVVSWIILGSYTASSQFSDVTGFYELLVTECPFSQSLHKKFQCKFY